MSDWSHRRALWARFVFLVFLVFLVLFGAECGGVE